MLWLKICRLLKALQYLHLDSYATRIRLSEIDKVLFQKAVFLLQIFYCVLHQVKGLTKATSSTSSPPSIKRPPPAHGSPQPSVRPAKLRRPASPTPYETPLAVREREGEHVVIGLEGGLPGIKTEHQEAPPLEGGREVAVPEYAEEVAEQFGQMPPDLHYQEEMAQALAEGTVGESDCTLVPIEIVPTYMPEKDFCVNRNREIKRPSKLEEKKKAFYGNLRWRESPGKTL